jgi:hypothetical protein
MRTGSALGYLQLITDQLAAAIYPVLLWPAIRLISRLERRIAA